MRTLFLFLFSFTLATAGTQANHPNKYREIFANAMLEMKAKYSAPPACNCDVTIPTTAWYIDKDKTANPNATVLDIKPGMTVCFAAGQRAVIELHNINGTPDKPITFRSCGGTVLKGTPGQHVLWFMNSSFLRVIGDDGSDYGKLEITGGGHGATFSDRTTNVEVAFLNLHDLGYSGIEVKTDPTCDQMTWRGNFVLQDVWIHDNTITNTADGEGMYVGQSHYNTLANVQKGPCASGVTKAKEHEVRGVRIENNRVTSTGADGIQVGAATTGCVIKFNTVKDYGKKNGFGQNAGIIENPGTIAEIYGNKVDTGTGFGIQLQGPGGSRVHHNLVINAGTKNGGALFVATYTCEGIPAQAPDQILSNTLINTNLLGVEYYNPVIFSKNILNVKSGAAFYKLGGQLGAITRSGNIELSGDPAQLKLDANYVPLEGSPAYGVDSDAGAFQSVKPPRIEQGSVEVIDSAKVIKAYIITPTKRIRIR